MIFDPTIQVPQEILDAARKVDYWAKMQGFDDYAIGPVRNRYAKYVAEEIEEIEKRLCRIESFLVL